MQLVPGITYKTDGHTEVTCVTCDEQYSICRIGLGVLKIFEKTREGGWRSYRPNWDLKASFTIIGEVDDTDKLLEENS